MTIESFEIVPSPRSHSQKLTTSSRLVKVIFVLTHVIVSLAMNSASNSFIITAFKESLQPLISVIVSVVLSVGIDKN